VPCAFCHQTGDVYRIGDGRLPKGKAHAEALHEHCAEAWFSGRPVLVRILTMADVTRLTGPSRK
jgi:hypothetical protein